MCTAVILNANTVVHE